jgi:hypothetical protein
MDDNSTNVNKTKEILSRNARQFKHNQQNKESLDSDFNISTNMNKTK